MRQPLVAGNWKMNGDSISAALLLESLLASSVTSTDGVDVVLCPPAVHIAQAVRAVVQSSIAVGGQDCSEFETGAYTGETAASMLRELGCGYVILGHSERRQMFGDSDERIVAKASMARAAGLKPILCVGETLQQREAGAAEQVVCEQVDALLKGGLCTTDVIAYEPVWAIGTGLTASPEQAQELHAIVRATLAEQDASLAQNIRLLYGGSVKAANAAELFAQEDIDGGLVGGAALDASEFIAIIEAGQG